MSKKVDVVLWYPDPILTMGSEWLHKYVENEQEHVKVLKQEYIDKIKSTPDLLDISS